VEAEGHAVRQPGDSNGTGGQVHGIEDQQVAAPLVFAPGPASSQPSPSAATASRGTNTGSDTTSPRGSVWMLRWPISKSKRARLSYSTLSESSRARGVAWHV